MTARYAVIGGSGFYSLGDEFHLERRAAPETPFGKISAEIQIGRWHGNNIVFLARHGESHQLAPHEINYRANLWALQSEGVTNIYSVNAVGGITPDLPPRTLALPDQIIDYTSARAHTFFDGKQRELKHIDFSFPYSTTMRDAIVAASESAGTDLVTTGTYGCTNGPRLETAAEIRKMGTDGCNMVGMTGMPEAALARELEIEYAAIALVVNWCAGIEGSVLDMDQIKQCMAEGMHSVKKLILATLERIER
ncbi:MAG: S-methyl-5'-thioinosine phosphorylase [Gammaproteobacteria bacterium]